MRLGDEVLRPDGSWARVESIEQRDGGATVYNFEVAQNHNYFVGGVGTLVHNTCNKPGGYATYDVDAHGNLQSNRASGHTPSAADGRVQSHHIVQDAWAKANIPNYNSDDAAAILLKSSSGESHALISAAQRTRRNARVRAGEPAFGNTNLAEELRQGYRDLINANVPQDAARRAAKRAYKYFDSLEAF